MNTDLQIFTNEKFGNVRTITDGETTLFCATDIARALEYSNPQKAVRDHCKQGTEQIVQHPQSAYKTIAMTFIPDGDVYRLIVRSNMPEAEKFEKWLFEEVLPSIRKHGGYLTPSKIEEALLNPDVLIRLATDLKLAQEQRKALEMQNAAMLPKADFYDAVMESPTTFDIETVSKILNVGIGRNKLFALLREQNVLRKNRNPFQYYVDLGWFKCVESNYKNRDGVTFVNVKTVVYQKGIDGILKLLKEKYGLIPKIVD